MVNLNFKDCLLDFLYDEAIPTAYSLQRIGSADLIPNELIASQEYFFLSKVDKFIGLLQQGVSLPPINVVKIQKPIRGRSYTIEDGHHRAVAYASIARAIPANVYSQDLSYGDNEDIEWWTKFYGQIQQGDFDNFQR